MVIGVLGGMGTFATIHIFEQYAKIFPAEKEWERPRLIIDNNCTMPSRVRAVLYGEKRDELIGEMGEIVRKPTMAKTESQIQGDFQAKVETRTNSSAENALQMNQKWRITDSQKQFSDGLGGRW